MIMLVYFTLLSLLALLITGGDICIVLVIQGACPLGMIGALGTLLARTLTG